MDASFGTGGIVITDLGGGSQDVIYDIAVQSDGKIVVAGQAGDANKDFSVTRYNSDGSLDTSFGTVGTTTISVGTSHDFGQGLALLSDGKIVVAGRVTGLSNGFGVARLNSDGSLDASFGTGGTTIEPTGGLFDEAWDLALQDDGSIVVVGNIRDADLENDFGLVRFSSEGVADSRFDLVNSLDGTPTFTEDGPAVVLDADVTIFDDELSFADNFNGATLTLQRNGGADSDDVFSGTGTITAMLEGNDLTVNGQDIGAVDSNSAGELQVNFYAAATQSLINEFIQQIAYSNTSISPPADVLITWSFSDGNSGAQGTGGPLVTTGTTLVDITAGNDAPAITSNGGGSTASIDVNDGSTTVTTITSSDPDGDTATYSISGGADASKFDIGSLSGVLTLKSAADFETPADTDNDGVYEVIVDVSDGAGGTDSQTIQATIVAPDIRLGYGQSTDATPQFREFDTIRDILSGERTTTEAGSTIRWSVSVLSPDEFEELVAILSDTGSATELNILRWDGESWTVDWTATDIASADSDKRGFSVAYESSSGHAVATYSNNTTNPVYRVWDGSNWSTEANVFATPPGSGTVLWVELASSPISDEITLVYSDTSELHTVVWDGSSWNEAATEETLKATLTGSGNSRAFDVAYESSGDVLVAWGDGSAVDFETRAAGTTTWVPADEFPVVSGIITFVDLAADPASDRIAFAGIDDNAGAARLGLMTWDGSAWQNVGEYDNGFPHILTDGFGEFWAGAGWVGTTGEAIAVYSDADAEALNWASWTAGTGWTIESDVTVTGTGLLRSVELAGYGNDGLATVFSDENGALWALNYEGGSWSVRNGGVALETTVSDLKTKPFSLSVERNGGNDAAVTDLNGSDQAGQNYSTSFSEGGGAVAVTDSDVTVSDIDHTTYLALGINIAGFVDGVDEEIRIDNEPFDFGVARVVTTTVATTTFNLDFDGSGFSIDNDDGGVIPESDLQDLIRSVEYINNSLNPTDGDRTFSFVVQDAGNLAASAAVSTISVSGVNTRPTLTAFADSVDTTLEDVEVEITFAEIAAQANEADADGAVTAFVVKSVPAGSLKIGTTAETAIAYSAAFNSTIDATQNAYWTPTLNFNGTSNAITVVAADVAGLESIGNIAVPVNVTAVNDAPTATMSDVYYFRNVDPDNNFDTSGTFATTNTVVSQGNDGSAQAYVTATQADGSLLGLLGFGENARVTRVGFSNRDPIAIWDGTGGLSQAGTSTLDEAVSLAFKFDSIGAGESVTFRYRYVFGETQAPVLDLDPDGSTGATATNANVSYTENDGAILIVDSNATIFDGDSTSLTGLTVLITNDLDGATESLSANTSGTSITASAYNSSTGVLALTGTNSVANYRQVLRSLSYTNTSETPDTETREIQFATTDGSFTSNTARTFVSVSATNDVPVITSNGGAATASISIAENETDVTTVTSSDLDSDTPSYSITGGADSTKFNIDSDSGELTFSTAPDFENATDSDTDNQYEVTVTVSDGPGCTDSQAISVTVTAVNNNQPAITSNGGEETATIDVAENSTEVTTVMATDDDLPAQELDFTISGGADAAKFEIDAASGELTFVAAPDFEAATDSGSHNTYEVIVRVSDGISFLDLQTITVSVTDVDEYDVSAISDANEGTDSVNENASNGATLESEHRPPTTTEQTTRSPTHWMTTRTVNSSSRVRLET